MKTHTVAIMGLGVRGKTHLRAMLKNPGRYRIVGLCDIDVAKMKKVAEDFGVQDVPQFTNAGEMLEKTRPEVFVFVTYPDLRLNMIELAARHGVKAVSLEKPMAESLTEAKAMRDVCRENGIKAVVCHQQKYLSQMREMKKRIDDGEIGTVVKIHCETQPWLAQLGTHFMDYAIWANGGHRAQWAVGHVSGPATLADNHPSPDFLLGEVLFENGARLYLECGYLAEAHNPAMYADSDNRITVYGTTGYVYAETDGFWGAFTKATNGELITGKNPGWYNHQEKEIQIGYYTEFADWLDDDSRPHSCNIDTAYHGYEILEAICLSALDNKRMDLPLTTFDYEPVFERMRRALPENGTVLRALYTGEEPRVERD